MSTFVDRHNELTFFNNLLTRARPGPAQLVLLYGRRRVGKTALLSHWVAQSDLPYTYWVADKESAALQRRSFAAAILNTPEESAPMFDSWPVLWRWLAPRLAQESARKILIIDELSYAAEADQAVLSALQHAWDQQLKDSNLVMVLCGSQVNAMESMMKHQSPLFGRFTGQWKLEPLPFAALREFFVGWQTDERVALYAVIGGIPAYLEWLDPAVGLVENIRDIMLAPGSMFMAEPQFLLYDELRDPQTYLSILQAISNGNHTLSAISQAALVERTGLPRFLQRLQELQLIERRLPVTLNKAAQKKSRQGRYHLADPFFRFYFRFLAPHQNAFMPQQETLIHIQNELRAFVGLGFEQLAQQWVAAQARAGKLPFVPEAIGAHWGSTAQIDVVAINWHTHDVLLGECKWGDRPVERAVVDDLVQRKGPALRAILEENGPQWQLHYAIFARAGLTENALSALQAHSGMMIDLPLMDQILTNTTKA
ncbi:MAG: ATP-binding protein [Caldilineaceae bacterium]